MSRRFDLVHPAPGPKSTDVTGVNFHFRYSAPRTPISRLQRIVDTCCAGHVRSIGMLSSCSSSLNIFSISFQRATQLPHRNLRCLYIQIPCLLFLEDIPFSVADSMYLRLREDLKQASDFRDGCSVKKHHRRPKPILLARKVWTRHSQGSRPQYLICRR